MAKALYYTITVQAFCPRNPGNIELTNASKSKICRPEDMEKLKTIAQDLKDACDIAIKTW